MQTGSGIPKIDVLYAAFCSCCTEQKVVSLRMISLQAQHGSGVKDQKWMWVTQAEDIEADSQSPLTKE